MSVLSRAALNTLSATSGENSTSRELSSMVMLSASAAVGTSTSTVHDSVYVSASAPASSLFTPPTTPVSPTLTETEVSGVSSSPYFAFALLTTLGFVLSAAPSAYPVV